MRYAKNFMYVFALSVVFAALMQLCVVQVGAQSASGSSAVIISNSNVTLSLSGRITVPVSVVLKSGTAGPTTLYVVNPQVLTGRGVSMAISNASGTPNFNANITIVTIPSIGVAAGKYVLALGASGADPSVGTSNLTLNIGPSTTQQTSVATVATSSIAAANSTVVQQQTTLPGAQQTTIPAATAPSNTNVILAGVVVVVLIVVIALAVKFRKR
jgi:hypothetical protein